MRSFGSWRGGSSGEKVPTLLVRDEQDRHYVTREVSPGCEWAVAGEGAATRKFDGTCVRFDGQKWWARREVKPGKAPPPGFVQEQHDEVTGKTVGWEPAEQSAYAKYVAEAVQRERPTAPGTTSCAARRSMGTPRASRTTSS